VVQLFGAEADFLAEAVRMLLDEGFAWFDLNLGCPAPKVARTGAGAALLRNPRRALDCARAMIAAAPPGRVGCKLRLGWDRPVFAELGKALEDAGAGWLSLHPRFACQGFSGMVRTEALSELAGALSLPVLASGDLLTAREGADRLRTGAAGVLFARGALADPTIFSRYRRILRGEEASSPLPPGALRALILRHLELAEKFSPRPADGRNPGLLKMRSVVPRYIRHLAGAKQLRQDVIRCGSWEHLRRLVEEFFRL
jgi:tRNA-dihydrouridine synthase B